MQALSPDTPKDEASVNLAVIGCGYVAEFYGLTLPNYPQLKLIGAYDHNEEKLAAFTRRWATRAYASLDHVLDDPSVGMILNLTNPRSHYEITSKCLEAGKHVYSEKPLAMNTPAAAELVALARSRNLSLGSAPCSLLSETAQTIWKGLREGIIGRVRLIYANFDDGMIAPKLAPWQWHNGSGAPWPAKDEFEVGCTFEHAGYILTWLAAFFGPANSVTSFSSCQIPDKGIAVDRMAPDFSVGCIEYTDNILARLTCSIVAPKDKSLTIVGDDGVIFTRNVRDDVSPVYVRRTPPSGREHSIEQRVHSAQEWLERHLPLVPWVGTEWHLWRKYPLVRRPPARFVSREKRVDFCRGPAEITHAIEERRSCRLSAELGLHITELVEALQYPERFGGRQKIESSFPPIEPLACQIQD